MTALAWVNINKMLLTYKLLATTVGPIITFANFMHQHKCRIHSLNTKHPTQSTEFSMNTVNVKFKFKTSIGYRGPKKQQIIPSFYEVAV